MRLGGKYAVVSIPLRLNYKHLLGTISQASYFFCYRSYYEEIFG